MDTRQLAQTVGLAEVPSIDGVAGARSPKSDEEVLAEPDPRESALRAQTSVWRFDAFCFIGAKMVKPFRVSRHQEMGNQS